MAKKGQLMFVWLNWVELLVGYVKLFFCNSEDYFQHCWTFTIKYTWTHETICVSGDIESMPFIEALRQLSFSVGNSKGISMLCILFLSQPHQLYNVFLFFFLWVQFLLCHVVIMYVIKLFLSGKENFCLIHVSLVPVLGVVGEQVNILLAFVPLNFAQGSHITVPPKYKLVQQWFCGWMIQNFLT